MDTRPPLKPIWTLVILAASTGCSTSTSMEYDLSSWEQQSNVAPPPSAPPIQQATGAVTFQPVPAVATPNACLRMPQSQWLVPQSCNGIGPTAQFVVNRLMTLWRTYPTNGICSYGREGSIGACGALGPNNAFYCVLSDSISWDYNFLNLQERQFNNFAPVVIIAHEWGHLNQARNGLSPNPMRLGRQNELHADCQAGIFAAVEESVGNLQPGDLNAAFLSLCGGGRPELGLVQPRGSRELPGAGHRVPARLCQCARSPRRGLRTQSAAGHAEHLPQLRSLTGQREPAREGPMKTRGVLLMTVFCLAFQGACSPPQILEVFAGDENAQGTASIGRQGEISVNARVLHRGTISYYYTSDRNADGFAENSCGQSSQKRCKTFAPVAASESHLLEPLSYRAGGITGIHTITLHVLDDSDHLETAQVQIEVTEP